MRHLAEAIDTAQWLNLDQLDPSRVPMHDAAFRKCSPRVAFELCKRFFHMLSFLDGLAWKSPGHWKLAEAAARGWWQIYFAIGRTGDLFICGIFYSFSYATAIKSERRGFG